MAWYRLFCLDYFSSCLEYLVAKNAVFSQTNPTPYSLLQYSINFTTFLLFFTACISGIMLSKHLLAEMQFHSTSDLIRKIHMTSTHWLQIMIGVHLGLHWKAITNLLANAYRLDLDHWLARKLIPAC